MKTTCKNCGNEKDHLELCRCVGIPKVPPTPDLGKHEEIKISPWERMRFKMALMETTA